MQHRRCKAAVVAALMLALSGLAFVSPSGASTRTQPQQGVTDDEIVVVSLVADLDGLREKGLIQQPKLTTGNLTKRWQGFLDSYGKVNGRKVRLETVVWDPLDTTTYSRACTQITQDIRPFVVLNSAGFRQSDVPCITIDGQTPLMSGDPMFQDLLDKSEGRLWSLMPPADVMGAGTADIIKKQGIVPKTAKIGILGSNDAGVKAASDALEQQLKKNGYDVASRVEVNQLSGDAAAVNRESAAAVATFSAAGVDTVFDGIPFIYTNGYFQEAQRSGAGFKTFVIDDAPSMCTIFGASRIPSEVVGVPCLTASDTRALPTKDGVKADSEFEAECRAVFDETFGEKSQPGVPSGDVTANGVTYTEDVDMSYCNIASVLMPAIKKAGKNLTWAKVAKNLEKTGSVPTAYLSGGEGSLGKRKHFLADKVHLVTLNPANTQTAKDANGLFNGCPAPVPCFIPQIIDGEEWFPIAQSVKSQAR